MRQVFQTNGILLTDDELYALECRFNNDMGFNYIWFLREADPRDYAVPKFDEIRVKRELLNAPTKLPNPFNEERDIVQVVAKIKGFTVRHRMRILEFMQGYDSHNEMCIAETDFRRALNAAGIFVSENEVNLVCDV